MSWSRALRRPLFHLTVIPKSKSFTIAKTQSQPSTTQFSRLRMAFFSITRGLLLHNFNHRLSKLRQRSNPRAHSLQHCITHALRLRCYHLEADSSSPLSPINAIQSQGETPRRHFGYPWRPTSTLLSLLDYHTKASYTGPGARLQPPLHKIATPILYIYMYFLKWKPKQEWSDSNFKSVSYKR